MKPLFKKMNEEEMIFAIKAIIVMVFNAHNCCVEVKIKFFNIA